MKKSSHFPNLANLFSPADYVDARTTTKGSSVSTKKAGVSWTDIQNPSKHALEAVATEHSLHEIHIAQCFQKGHIAQVTGEQSYVFLTINFPVFVAASDRIISSSLNVFLGKHYLVTVHDGTNSLVRRYFEYYEQQPSGASTAAELLYNLIQELLAETAALIQKVFEELDVAEAAVFDDKASDAYIIGKLRQKIIGLRRTLTNQSEVLDELRSMIHEYAEGHLQHHYKSNTSVSRKLWEATDEAKEIIEVYQDVDFTSSTAKTNKILAVLTLLFTLTIPATVLGTFYGMNVPLPGGIEAGAWTFFGPFTTLKIIAFVSIVSAGWMYVYFKRRKWF